jgi:hypothetical protein
MSTEVATVTHLMSPADEAHLALRRAVAQLEGDYWAMADAVHAAHESQAWLRDDRAHEARYRKIMVEHKLPSIFAAYVFDEFGMREAAVGFVDIAGRLRSAVAPLSPDKGVDWSRFTMNAIRPIGATIIDTYEADDVAAALVTAQRLAEADARAHPVAGRVTEEHFITAPVKPSHVRAALVEHGIQPPRAKALDEMERAERRRVKIERARVRLAADANFLLAERRRRDVVEVVKSIIRRLGDQPTLLDELGTELQRARDES